MYPIPNPAALPAADGRTAPSAGEPHGTNPLGGADDRATGDVQSVAGSEGPPCKGPSSDGPSKGGPPAKNANAAKHFLRADPAAQNHRLVLGTLPGSMEKTEKQARQFRTAVEQAVVDTHGTISLTNACLIATAARWERHGLLALRWLRERHDALDDGQRLAYSKAIAEASERRDKAIERLKLERDPQSEIDAFYARLRAGAIEAAPTDDDAPEANVDDLQSNEGQRP